MRKIVCAAAVLSLLLCGCAEEVPQRKQYTATFLTLFDTVTSIVGMAESEGEFRTLAQAIHDELLQYHRLFDIYNDYDGISNLKTVNDAAGLAPVEVDGRIIEFLLDCKDYAALTGGKVNPAMGSVLRLWHEARTEGIRDPEAARLPDGAALEEAKKHMDFDTVLIDEDQSTVCISDPNVRLDVGAAAKGWAVQRVAETAPPGLLISVGGNVCATGPKDEAGIPWTVGIQNPDGGAYLHTLSLTEGSVVTSGDYQRYFWVDGQRYHHIIDPETLCPSTYWRSVTIVCADSGLADALSTALFLLPRDEGQALLTQCGAEAMWVDHSGEIFYSPGFLNWILR